MKELLDRHPALRTALAGPLAIRRAYMKQKRRAAETVIGNIQAVLADDPVIRVAEFDGVFRVSARSHLFARVAASGWYEPELATLFAKYVKPDMDVLDVGANVGFYSVLAAKKLTSGRVLAVEPSAAVIERLQSNLDRNGVADRVITYQGLASDTPGTSTFHTIDGMEEYSSIAAIVHPSAAGQHIKKSSVPTSTIDDLVRTHGLRPAVMKVDVEGAEELVFKGAMETLRTYRPVILSELSVPLLAQFGSTSDRVIEMLRGLGYSVVDPMGSNAAGAKQYGDILCIPMAE